MTTKIPHIIHVDLQSHAKRQIVYMKQGDEMSRELLIFFYNGGSAWAVPSEITSVSLSYCKADKVHGCYDHIADEEAYVFNSERTSVTMAIHPQVLTAAGNVICELKLCNAAGHALNTFNFVINCEQSPHAMGQQSEGYWNNVFDGATFTPHVSSDGILSWTNDKGLPNPDPVDIALYGFIVPEDGVPVQTIEVVTSENAVENIEANNKVLAPAAAQALIDRLLPAPISVTLLPAHSQYYSPSIREFSTTKQYAKNEFCYRKPDNDTYTHFYYCKNNAGHLGDWADADFQDYGRILDPTLDASLAAVNWNDYIPAAERGTVILQGKQKLYRQAYAFDSTNRIMYFLYTEQNAAAWLYFTFDVNGAITGCTYNAYSFASAS